MVATLQAEWETTHGVSTLRHPGWLREMRLSGHFIAESELRLSHCHRGGSEKVSKKCPSYGIKHLAFVRKFLALREPTMGFEPMTC